MLSKTKGWPEARRRAQAERCRKYTPSARSTGPKTDAGKKEACLNAQKHGLYSKQVRQTLKFLKMQKNFLKKLQ